MANYLSPGVYVKEIDNSAIVPTVSNSVAFFGGNFTKGPIEQPFVITNKGELETYFGKPTDKNYNEWFQCSKFLDYSNQLVISRAFTESKQYLSTIETIGAATENGTSVQVAEIADLYVGTIITFEGTSSQNYEITEIATTATEEEIQAGSAVWLITFTNAVDENGETATGGLDGPVANNSRVIIFLTHQNAGIDAYQNVEVRAESNLTMFNDYNQDFDLYKNKTDFDYKADSIAFSVIPDGEAGAGEDMGVKLKFIAQTAGSVENNIEIAIVNSYDFFDYYDPDTPIQTDTKAQAFPGESVLNFFDYTPEGEDVGIIIRSGDTTETYIVSFDQAAVDGNNKSKYVETVINDNSRLVYVVDNVSNTLIDVNLAYGKIDDNTNSPIVDTYKTFINSFITTDSQGNVVNEYVSNPDPWINGVFGNLVTYGGESPALDASDKGSFDEAYFEVQDKELFEIDIVIGNEIDEGDSAISLAVDRADCIAMVGSLYGDVVGKKAAVATDNLVNYILRNSAAPERTMFASFFGNYHRIYDNYGKKFRWINVAGDMAGLRANTNTNQASWWASAGLKRGVVRNIDKLAFSPSLPQRDQLYKNNINPIVNFPGEGNLCWGQKTLINYASSFDRINVRGLFNTIERAMSKASRSSVFEFNDPFTRNAILAMFNPYLSGVKAGRGISDFLVICDTTNNTPDVISRNELVVDIYIKPAYAAEFIQLTFNNVGTRSFSTVIGA